MIEFMSSVSASPLEGVDVDLYGGSDILDVLTPLITPSAALPDTASTFPLPPTFSGVNESMDCCIRGITGRRMAGRASDVDAAGTEAGFAAAVKLDGADAAAPVKLLRGADIGGRGIDDRCGAFLGGGAAVRLSRSLD